MPKEIFKVLGGIGLLRCQITEVVLYCSFLADCYGVAGILLLRTHVEHSKICRQVSAV